MLSEEPFRNIYLHLLAKKIVLRAILHLTLAWATRGRKNASWFGGNTLYHCTF